MTGKKTDYNKTNLGLSLEKGLNRLIGQKEPLKWNIWPAQWGYFLRCESDGVAQTCGQTWHTQRKSSTIADRLLKLDAANKFIFQIEEDMLQAEMCEWSLHVMLRALWSEWPLLFNIIKNITLDVNST